MNGDDARMTGGERRPARNGPRAAAFALAALALAFAAAPSPAAAEERQDEYRIGAGDTLDITVFGHDDLSSEVLVDGSGRISLPLAVTPAAGPASAGNRKATYLVVGSFRRMREADRMAERLTDVPTTVTPAVVDGKVYFRVVTGPFAKDEMDAARAQFAALGIGDIWAISLCTADLSAPPCVARQKTARQRRDVESGGDTLDSETESLATGVLEADRAAGVGRPTEIPPPVEAEVPIDVVSSVAPLPPATSPATNGSNRMPAVAPATTGNRDVPSSDATLDEYRIGAGDTLDITVFGHDDLSSEVLVDGSGRISLPLLGQVDAGGKTIAELQALITEVLDRDFIVEPRVSIEVTNYRPFYILGQVNKPGSYSYVEGMTVRMAVALAGGFTRRARESSVVVIRAEHPERDSIDAELDDRLFPGDSIEVERRLF